METTEQSVPVENNAAEQVVTDTTPQTEQPATDTSSSTNAPVETIAAPEEEIKLDPVKPFEAQRASVPNEDIYTPDKVLSAYKGKEKELFEAVAKANGLSEFQQKALPIIKDKDTLLGYADAIRTNWTQVSAYDLIAKKLKEDYSQFGWTDEKVNRAVEIEMRDSYAFGIEDDPESEEVFKGQMRAERDAAAYRQQMISRQQEVLQQLSQFQPQQPEAAAQPSPVERMEEQRNWLVEDPNVKGFVKSKTIKFGDFNYESPDPQKTMAVAYDENLYAYHLAEKDEHGQPRMQDGQFVTDRSKLLKVAAYVENMEDIEKALINHGITLGKKQQIDEREGIQDNRSFGTETKQESLAELFAKAPIIG